MHAGHMGAAVSHGATGQHIDKLRPSLSYGTLRALPPTCMQAQLPTYVLGGRCSATGSKHLAECASWLLSQRACYANAAAAAAAAVAALTCEVHVAPAVIVDAHSARDAPACLSCILLHDHDVTAA